MKLPIVSLHLGEKTVNVGGWLDMLSRSFYESDNELILCFPNSEIEICGEIGNVKYISFYRKKGYPLNRYNKRWESDFKRILSEYSPDIIHIWGCEFAHSLAMVRAIQDDYPYIVSLHGLPDIISEHYTEGLPAHVVYGFTFRDLFKLDNILLQKRKYLSRGKFAREIIETGRYFIGRTNYDKAFLLTMNERAIYHHCNETLRSSFYSSKKWSINNCEKHSIFCSQVHYPIKGFHYLLHALALLKRKYPDLKVYIAGQNMLEAGKLKRQSYSKYIIQLINKYQLENNIAFLGSLSENEMCFQYLNANVFVSSSLTENESNSISEAKYLGVPIVASFVGGVTERLEHYNSGYFYQQNEPMMLAFYIDKIFSDEHIAEQLSKKAIDESESCFNQIDNYKQHISIYESTIREWRKSDNE